MAKEPTKHRPTSSDVARAAGVSKWTVIRAFTPGASIKEQSRKRILAEAGKLGYTPNLLARSLATRTTNLVAVLVDDFTNFHKLPALEALTLALQAEGMACILININQQFDHLDALLHAEQRQVDAVVLLGTAFRNETLRQHARHDAGPPLFVLARESTMPSIPSIDCDAGTAMDEIGAHLWQRGYRRPGFMSGPRTLSTALGRNRAFKAFWNGHRIDTVQELCADNYSPDAAAQTMRRYLRETPAEKRIDVLMCENDVLTVGAIDVMRFEFRLRVPQDIALVGFDGLPITAAPAYDITTYEQPLAQMTQTLVDMIKGRTPPTSTAYPGRLIVRSST